MEGSVLDAVEVARKVVKAAGDKQAIDILLLDTQEVCSFADYFVICSGDSDRQIEAIHDEIKQTLKREGILPHHSEGGVSSGWLLLDFGDVIVHIFSPFEREYYQLEKLWSQARLIVRIQ